MAGRAVLQVDQAAYLSGANLSGANLSSEDLRGANLSGANLSGADLSGANLRQALLIGARLLYARLEGAYLLGADLRDATLTGASLEHVGLVRTNLEGATISNCRVYGISAWDVILNDETKQLDLVVTPEGEPVLSVDNLEVAQFMYLLTSVRFKTLENQGFPVAVYISVFSIRLQLPSNIAFLKYRSREHVYSGRSNAALLPIPGEPG
jgi:uncharacterized protein YjbI with pentapeptide repeats